MHSMVWFESHNLFSYLDVQVIDQSGGRQPTDAFYGLMAAFNESKTSKPKDKAFSQDFNCKACWNSLPLVSGVC